MNSFHLIYMELNENHKIYIKNLVWKTKFVVSCDQSSWSVWQDELTALLYENNLKSNYWKMISDFVNDYFHIYECWSDIRHIIFSHLL